jgi:uncharacterized protein (TIGR02271 family)
MSATDGLRLIDRDGRCARLTGASEGQTATVVLEGGGEVRIPSELLARQDNGTYTLAARFADFLPSEPSSVPTGLESGKDETVIPVIAESLHVGRERVVTGKVRLRKVVRQEEQTIDEPILKEQVSVERVAVDQWVDEPPPIRSDGGTLIVPVVEEVLVVEKRLRLREEIRLTWHHEEEHAPQTLTVRREEIRIDRALGEERPEEAGEDRGPPSSSGKGDDAEPGKVP